MVWQVKCTHTHSHSHKTDQTNESERRTIKLISISIESMNILSIAFIGVFIGEIIFCIPNVPFDLRFLSPHYGSASHHFSLSFSYCFRTLSLFLYSFFLCPLKHFVVRIFSSLSSIFYDMVLLKIV